MNEKSGFLYVLSNQFLNGRDGRPIYKIGFSKDLPSRLGTLNTSMPANFKVEKLYETVKYRELEDYVKSDYATASIKTELGGKTEFFDLALDEIDAKIRRVAKLCDAVECDGSVYIGRSASAIRKNLQKREKELQRKITQSEFPLNNHVKNWLSSTALSKAFAAAYNKGKGANGIQRILTRKRAPGKWRESLAAIGVVFDRDGMVEDWQAAIKPL